MAAAARGTHRGGRSGRGRAAALRSCRERAARAPARAVRAPARVARRRWALWLHHDPHAAESVTRSIDGSHAPADHHPLRASDALLIVAFWTVLALLTAASALLDPRGGPGREAAAAGRVAFAFLTSYLWAALTPLIFWLGSRFGGERGSWPARVLLLAAAGVVVAIGVEAFSAYLRFEIFDGPRRSSPGGELHLPRVFNPLFGATRLFWLDDLIIYIAVLAAGFARDNFLRYRARQEEAVRLAAETAQLQAQLAEARLEAL